jgi:hypothetical protein
MVEQALSQQDGRAFSRIVVVDSRREGRWTKLHAVLAECYLVLDVVATLDASEWLSRDPLALLLLSTEPQHRDFGRLRQTMRHLRHRAPSTGIVGIMPNCSGPDRRRFVDAGADAIVAGEPILTSIANELGGALILAGWRERALAPASRRSTVLITAGLRCAIAARMLECGLSPADRTFLRHRIDGRPELIIRERMHIARSTARTRGRRVATLTGANSRAKDGGFVLAAFGGGPLLRDDRDADRGRD